MQLASNLRDNRSKRSSLYYSEHPPVRGGEMSKRLGGIKGCKYKKYSFVSFERVRRLKVDAFGFPLNSQYNVGDRTHLDLL